MQVNENENMTRPDKKKSEINQPDSLKSPAGKYNNLICEIHEKIAVITLLSPPLNSLTIELLNNLGIIIDELNQNPDVKVIIITGSERVFSGGMDIKEMSGCKTARAAGEMSKTGQIIFSKIENSPKPVIAAINGFCMGGGFELALSCHIRIASDNAILGMPEISIGMIPAFGGSYRLPALAGRGRAIELILTGKRLTPGEALEFNLVNRVVPKNNLMHEVMKLADILKVKSAFTMRLALKSIIEGSARNILDAMKLESSNVEELYNGHDLKEGVFASIQKRKPDFLDR